MNRSNPDIGAWLHDDEFGWKARLGVINPSAGVTFDHEWARMLPKGVSFHVTRVLLEQGTAAALDAMAQRAPDAAALLKTSRIDALCYGCTIGSLYRGRAGEQALANRLTETSGAPVVMMADSAVEALKYLGASRIAVANPFTPEINRLIRAYLEESGFKLSGVEALSIAESWNITKLSPREVSDLAKRAYAAGPCDAIFLSCGNMRTIEAIARIEEDIGIPVISSNQAMLWNALRKVGVKVSLPGFGQLLELPAT